MPAPLNKQLQEVLDNIRVAHKKNDIEALKILGQELEQVSKLILLNNLQKQLII